MNKLTFCVSQSMWKKAALSHSSGVHSSVEEKRQTEPNISMPKFGESFDSGAHP